MSDILKTSPAVFAVGDTYQITVPVKSSCLMWVRVGDELYYDDSNGIIRSDVTTHKMVVPMEELDKTCSYTVCYRPMIERKPYFSDTGDVEEITYSFRPVKSGRITAYHIADAHNKIEGPVAAANFFKKQIGGLDLLILNGDIPNDSGAIENFDNIYKIIEGVTDGEIPVVFSRGNHDTRGIFAEKIADHTPVQDGNSYFTFRLGDLWGMVLDCGEDKVDSHPEYGNTVCCHQFRKRQTKFIEKVIQSASSEYEAEGVTHKVIISHVPFYRTFPSPFDIEGEIYSEWCRLIAENIKPELMIHGHEHFLAFDMPGDECDVRGLPCPAVIASVSEYECNDFIGGGFIFGENNIDITFNDKNKIHGQHKIKL